jgi:hypothetical protein
LWSTACPRGTFAQKHPAASRAPRQQASPPLDAVRIATAARPPTAPTSDTRCPRLPSRRARRSVDLQLVYVAENPPRRPYPRFAPCTIPTITTVTPKPRPHPRPTRSRPTCPRHPCQRGVAPIIPSKSSLRRLPPSRRFQVISALCAERPCLHRFITTPWDSHRWDLDPLYARAAQVVAEPVGQQEEGWY